jgi:hypothetical protein
VFPDQTGQCRRSDCCQRRDDRGGETLLGVSASGLMPAVSAFGAVPSINTFGAVDPTGQRVHDTHAWPGGPATIGVVITASSRVKATSESPDSASNTGTAWAVTDQYQRQLIAGSRQIKLIIDLIAGPGSSPRLS